MPSFLLTRLLRGATVDRALIFIDPVRFLLTRLLRGATYDPKYLPQRLDNFYSRASCEARLRSIRRSIYLDQFLLTRLLRGATVEDDSSWEMYDISTHAPLARRDVPGERDRHHVRNFYSRASCEARPCQYPSVRRFYYFYSRASCEARLIACRDSCPLL